MSRAGTDFYLERQAPDAPDVVAEVAARVWGRFVLWDEKPEPVAIIRDMVRLWQPRSGATTDAIERAVFDLADRKAIEAEASRAEDVRRQKEAAAKARAKQDAAREAERRQVEEKERRASDLRNVMDQLEVGYRQAWNLLKYGTTLPDQAERLAEVTGRKAAEFFRPRAKPGRRINFVKIFTRPRLSDTSFRKFAGSDLTEFEIEGAALRAFEAIAAERVDFEDFKDFANRTRLLGIEGDHAAAVWRKFERYCVRTISDLALAQIREEEEVEQDFG